MKRRLLLATAATLLATPVFAQTKWDMPTGYPATNYMSTYYALQQDPIPNVSLRYVLWRARGQAVMPGTFAGVDERVDLADPDAREHLSNQLMADPAIAGGGALAEQERVAAVARRLGVDWDRVRAQRLFHLLTPAECAEVTRRGFDLHALDGITLVGQIFVQECSGQTLVIGGGFDIYELFGQLNGVDRHVFQHT